MKKSFSAWALCVFLAIAAIVSFAAQYFAHSKEVTPMSTYGLYLTKTAPALLPKNVEVASFAAGCFWGVEQEFRKEPGVLATAVGYMGGHTKNPTYEQVCEGDTGHAEVVQVEFDPQVLSYETLLTLFWELHDPTTLNRQGPDAGAQYRSAIFFYNEVQHMQAELFKEKLQASGELSAKIVTQIVPASEFTKAEEYHQQYVEKGGRAACHFRVKKK